MTALHRSDQQVLAVLFDMDNTLFDFVQAQLSACRAILDHLGLSGDPEDVFGYFRRPVHGFEHHDNIRDFLQDTGIFTVRTFAECCAIYDTEKVAAVTPYPGIVTVLQSLRDQDLPLGVVTDALNGNAVKRLKKAQIAEYFNSVISPDLSGAAKPAPASFLLALRRLGVSAEKTVLIGDSIRRDIEPAQKIGMITIYARYGDRYASVRDPDCMPDYCAMNVPEIGTVLTSLLRT